MFVVIELQLRVFRTDLYRETVLSFSRGEGIVLDSLRDLHSKMQETKLTEAITNWKTREVRKKRIDWLKKSIGSRGGNILGDVVQASGPRP